jgi:BirA family biotin operon repressor/biotin-[acetyl-CoA-carboxylase] ligase
MNQPCIGQEIINLLSTESTNDYIKELADDQKISEGSLVIAAEQSQGRGYGNNTWFAESGKNLTFSFLLKPNYLKAEQQFLISKMVSLSLLDYLKEYSNEVCIKWPNDIFIRKNKIAGILIENDLAGKKILQTIVGIGININQEEFPASLPNPISLAQLTQKKYSLKEELNKIISALNRRYAYLVSKTNHKLNKEYHKYLFRKDQLTMFQDHNSIFQAKIKGVTDFGQIILETNDGKRLEYNFKEIEFIL